MHAKKPREEIVGSPGQLRRTPCRGCRNSSKHPLLHHLSPTLMRLISAEMG